MATPNFIKRFKYRLLLPLLSCLPRNWAFQLVTQIGIRFFFHYEQEWVESYRQGLRMVFTDSSDDQIEHWVVAHFGMMSREELDVFYLSRMNQNSWQCMVHLLENALSGDESRGKILIMAHAGRPIMLSSALGLSGLKVGMLSQVIDERNPHLDAPTRNYLQYKMHHTVRIAGGRWVTTEDHLRVLYKALKQDETIIIMMDLVEPNVSRQVRVPFFNGELKLPPGIIRLAQQSKAKLYYGNALDEGATTKCSVVALPDNPEQAMQLAAHYLERDILTTPWQWWQWNNLPALWSRI